MCVQRQETGGCFSELGPDRVLNLAERALKISCTNLFRPLNSYINRVFEVEGPDKTGFVVKFYRPGRWSRDAILEEHRFLLELAARELPVVPPLLLENGETLAEDNGIYFGIFPKCGGRSVDEFSDGEWLQLGRLLGRVHQVGEMVDARYRIRMLPRKSTLSQLDFLMASRCVPEDLKPALQKTVLSIVDDIVPIFKETEIIRIHGDCHFANVIKRPGESLFLIDFDDMAMGPPVQDIWMLLPGDIENSFIELELFLEGYETFRSFDRRTLCLLEPLRAMRFIHYMAWCAHQVEDDGLTRAVDGFGSRDYWQKEINDLLDQRSRIAAPHQLSGNIL